MAYENIKIMANLADSGQDEFVESYVELAKTILYEQGVSKAFIESPQAEYILAKVLIDLVDDNNLSNTTLSLIATLRVNHPHGEDNV